MTRKATKKGAAETFEFQAEVSRLLHLMVHSVYSNRDIFLRELISNGADACEKLRYLAVQDAALLGDDTKFSILLIHDPDNGTLTVADNGVGMNRDELAENLGRIAHSGTRSFLDTLEQAGDGSALIGQFGIGFYSAFMVADSVEVLSRRAGEEEAWLWRSDGKGEFEIEPAPADRAPARGTRVVLHLTEESKGYAEAGELERIVRAYSAHVPVPIEIQKADEETRRELADGTALWTRSKSDIDEKEYAEFYGHVGGQFDEPAEIIHYRAEGRHEYSVLLFVPSMKPFDLFDPDRKGRIRLYVRRVFISDDADLLPPWLRFVRGVIDSEDLPLNLSREMLQSNPILEAIRKGVTNRILSDLKKLADNDADKYLNIWDQFGAVIKEGLYEDMERRDKIYEIARFHSTKSTDGWRSLSDYVADMKENQTAIYYVLGDDAEKAARSPQIEGFKARGIEVLLLTDPVDAFWVQTAAGFDGKPFQSVTQGSADLDAIEPEKRDEDEKDSVRDADIATLIARIKEALGDKVSDVRSSNRLSESAVCLVASDAGPDMQLEKLLARQQGQGAGLSPVMEINPHHALIRKLAADVADKDKAAGFDDAAWLLFGQARILDGQAPEDPADFVARMTGLMVSGG